MLFQREALSYVPNVVVSVVLFYCKRGIFFCLTYVVQQLVLTSSNTRCCLRRMGKDAGNCLFCRNQKQNHHLVLVATFRVKTEIPVFSRVLLCEFFCVHDE